ncbi:MAG: tetratricopeptide repeat protein [Bacteroidaceae bacterium]|nr:tetratricopeptide repeat protein [Bacteroidaceae bacterium]
MKKIPLLIFLIEVCCLASCHRRPVYPPVLHEADSLINVNADSALSMLKQLETDTASWTKAARMYHQLLTVKAGDKAYHLQTSDSLMLQVLHYYKDGGDKRLLPEAYYYMGSAYRDLNDAPRALDYYQKAIDAMPGDVHLRVKSKVYAQMGELFIYQHLYEEAIKPLKASYRCDSLMNDTIGMIYNLADLANSYRGMGDLSNALRFFDSAKRLADIYGDINYSNLISSQIARLQISLGNYQDALELLELPLKYIDSTNVRSIYAITASAYYALGRLDSASYYYNKLKEINDVYAQRTSNEYLARIANAKGHPEEAMDFITNYEIWNDSVQKITVSESLSRMKSLYDYSLRERENTRLSEENMQIQRRTWLVSTLLVLVLSLSIIGFMYYTAKRRSLRKKYELLSKLLSEEQKNGLDYVQRNECKIHEYQSQILLYEKEKTAMTEQLEAYKKQYELANQMADIKRHQKENSKNIVFQSDIYKKLTEQCIPAEKHLTADDVKAIEEILNLAYPDFISSLHSFGKMSDTEKQVCYLRKMQLSPSDIGILLNRAKSSISSIRSRLYEKAFGKSGTSEEWDKILDSL